MHRALRILIVAAAAALPTVPHAACLAGQVDLSLNLIYDAPYNPNSGGTWQVVARNDAMGLAWATFRLDGQRFASSSLVAPSGQVNGQDAAGFVGSIRNFSLQDVATEYTITFNREVPVGSETGVFYGVGALPNGSPGDLGPTYATLTNVGGAPWGVGDPLGDPAWDRGALLFSGTFAPGNAPAFLPNTATAAEFSSLAGASPTTAADDSVVITNTVLRDNLVSIAGDYNADGHVDARDYTLWRDTFGQSITPPGAGADGNANGLVDTADYSLWRANFGASPAPKTGTIAVPSPASLACLAPWISALFAPRRRPVHPVI